MSEMFFNARPAPRIQAADLEAVLTSIRPAGVHLDELGARLGWPLGRLRPAVAHLRGLALLDVYRFHEGTGWAPASSSLQEDARALCVLGPWC